MVDVEIGGGSFMMSDQFKWAGGAGGVDELILRLLQSQTDVALMEINLEAGYVPFLDKEVMRRIQIPGMVIVLQTEYTHIKDRVY